MPIYEYQCPKCGVFEVTQRITADPLKRCPTCRSRIERILSRSSFILKGTGWYETDYGHKGASVEAANAPSTSNGAGPAESSAGGSSDTKPAGKAKKESSAAKADSGSPAESAD